MKNYINNDYIITKKTAEDGKEHYFAQFIDGEGKKQFVQVEKEVADAIISSQREEASLERKNRRYCVSLDDYSDKLFCRDVYSSLVDSEEMTDSQKVRKVLSLMKPNQAEILKKVFFENKTQQQIADELGVKRQSVAERIDWAKNSFKKFFSQLF